MPDTIKINKGDTLYDIGLKYRIDWKTIWNHQENIKNRNLGTRNGPDGRTIRKPEWIAEGQVLYIPDFYEIQKSGIRPNETAVCVIRDPVPIGTEIPRFDCHCHAHADSIFRTWIICGFIPSEAKKALVCNAEVDNFHMVSNPGGSHGRVAVIPLMMDMAYGPLWTQRNHDSTIELGKIDLFSDRIGRTSKFDDQPTAWDPWNIYPMGDYYICDNDFLRWRDAIVKVHRANPGYCFPFVPFDPRRPDALDLVKDCIFNFGFVGIKLYTRQGWRLSRNTELVGNLQTGLELDRRVAEALKWAEQNDVPVLNHCSPGGWPKDDDHIAFPKGRCFEKVIIAERDLRNFESNWWENAFSKVTGFPGKGGGRYVQFPRPILASGRIRLGVIAYLKKRMQLDSTSCRTLAKNSLSSSDMRPMQFMNNNEFAEWVSYAAGYAEAYAVALADYKRLTVEPDPELKKKYPKLRFCLAHSGSECIIKSEIPNDAIEAIEYSNQNSTEGWLDQHAIKNWLDCHPTSYVDISFFSGIRKYSSRVEIFVKLLKWFKKIGRTEQVLFGTDWPLTWIADTNVRESWDTVHQAASQVNEWKSCWDDLTRNNPLRFLNLKCDSKTINRLHDFLGHTTWQTTWMAARGWCNSRRAISDRLKLELSTKIIDHHGVPHVNCMLNNQTIAEGVAQAWDYAFCKMRCSLSKEDGVRLITIEISPTIQLKRIDPMPAGFELAMLTTSIDPSTLPFVEEPESVNTIELAHENDDRLLSQANSVGASAESVDEEWDMSDPIEWIHNTLDLAGCVPGIGEPADGLNAILYAVQGRYGEAAISAAAMIPVVGEVGKAARIGKKTYSRVRELTSKFPAQGLRKELSRMVGKTGARAFGETKLLGQLANTPFDKLPESSQQLKNLFKRHSPFEMGDEIWAQLKGQKFGQKKDYTGTLHNLGWSKTDSLKKLEDVLNFGTIRQADFGRLAIVHGNIAVIVEPLKAASKGGKSRLISIRHSNGI